MRPDRIINALLDELGILYEYRKFNGANIPAPPFIAYIFERERFYGSDERNLMRTTDVLLELHTAEKDFDTETALENKLSHWELDKTEDYILSDNLYIITYRFTLTTKWRA